MVEINVLDAKHSAAGHSSGVMRNTSVLLRRDHKQPALLKRRSGSLRRGVEIDLLNIRLENFNALVTSLKSCSNTALRLDNRSLGSDGEFDPVRFKPSDPTTCAALEKFSRALARAVGAGGWVQELELGFCQSRQDIKALSQALSCSSSLQHLSLANSALGDEKVQLLAGGLSGCIPLQILDLSGCALTDESAASITSILKMGVRRTADAEWRLSLRESGGSRFKRTPKLHANQGLGALDLSFNMFSDATSGQLCDVLQLGAPLEALNLQGNQLRRRSAQLYLIVFKTWGFPRLVDLRKNLDGKDVGVLEDGRHLHSFSRSHAPFWNASLFGISLENRKPEQVRKPSLQKQNPGLSCNPPRRLPVIDPGTSSYLTSLGPLLTNNVSSTAQERPDYGEHVGWSCPSNPLVLGDSSPRERESTAREECPAANDQRAGPVSIKPLSPSVCFEHRVDPISPFRWNNEDDQVSTRPILDIPKEYPHALESEGRRSNCLVGHHSPLHPDRQPSGQIRGQTITGEGSSRPLSPILDPATPELTSRKHLKRDATVTEKDGSKLPYSTSAEFSLGCRRAETSVDDVNRATVFRLDVRQGSTLESKRQPGEQKMRKSTQDSRQTTSEHKTRDKNLSKETTTDPVLKPGRQELGYRQNTRKTVSYLNQQRTQTRRAQHHSVYFTSERQREESEWGTFMWDMARSLMHLQEGLDILMEPSKAADEVADKVPVPQLHQIFTTTDTKYTV